MAVKPPACAAAPYRSLLSALDLYIKAYDGFLAELPVWVDPCGERGEFHTFAYDGPMFAQPVPVRCGEIVQRDGFVFADLLEESAPA